MGGLSRATCFSFYATKNLPIGEGGMITTGDEELADWLRTARMHGMTKMPGVDIYPVAAGGTPSRRPA